MAQGTSLAAIGPPVVAVVKPPRPSIVPQPCGRCTDNGGRQPLTLQSAPKLSQPRFEVGFSMQVIRRTPLEVSSSQMFYSALQPLVRNVVPVSMQPRCGPVGHLLPRSCASDQSKQLFFDVIPTRPGIRFCQCKSCAKFFQPVLKVRLSVEVGRRTGLHIRTGEYADGLPYVH